MIEIPLGGRKGGVVLVDDVDLWATAFHWHPHTRGYAQRACKKPDGRKGIVLLHRELMGFPVGLVDHINRDVTDNQRSNLRIATPTLNAQNRSKRVGTISRFRGVTKKKRCASWIAYAELGGVEQYLGSYPTEEEAALVAQAWRLANMPGATD